MVGGIIFLPAIYVFWLSLNQSSFGQAASFVGLANYVKVLSDPYFWRRSSTRSSSSPWSSMSNCCSAS
jgi:ABC-type sugar transport system permease subunit